MKTKAKKGFTIIELLVVIAIIGLLAVIAYLILNQSRVKARDAKRLSDIRQIQSGLELFYADHESYPQSGADGEMFGASSYFAMPTPPPQNDGDCSNGGIDGQATDVYPYASYFTPADRDGNLPIHTKGVVGSQGTRCTEDDEIPCEAYVITTCLGSPSGGLRAGVVRATDGGMSN